MNHGCRLSGWNTGENVPPFENSMAATPGSMQRSWHLKTSFGSEKVGSDASGAVFSPCRKYRYWLWRRWGEAGCDEVTFIGLNPSTADELSDDPTIRRCINFAKKWGFGQLNMLNIFAYRATDPKVMKAAADPVGEENEYAIVTVCQGSKLVIAAWGAHGSYRDQDRRVIELAEKYFGGLDCLGTTKHGFPKHPLYLRSDSQPQIFI